MKFYKVILSNKTDVTIDQQDFDKLLAGLNSGSFVKLKNAIINPSFVSHVMPIDQNEALATENAQEKIEGYLDEERGVYVVTKETRPVVTELTDKFIPSLTN